MSGVLIPGFKSVSYDYVGEHYGTISKALKLTSLYGIVLTAEIMQSEKSAGKRDYAMVTHHHVLIPPHLKKTKQKKLLTSMVNSFLLDGPVELVEQADGELASIKRDKFKCTKNPGFVADQLEASTIEFASIGRKSHYGVIKLRFKPKKSNLIPQVVIAIHLVKQPLGRYDAPQTFLAVSENAKVVDNIIQNTNTYFKEKKKNLVPMLYDMSKGRLYCFSYRELSDHNDIFYDVGTERYTSTLGFEGDDKAIFGAQKLKKNVSGLVAGKECNFVTRNVYLNTGIFIDSSNKDSALDAIVAACAGFVTTEGYYKYHIPNSLGKLVPDLEAKLATEFATKGGHIMPPIECYRVGVAVRSEKQKYSREYGNIEIYFIPKTAENKIVVQGPYGKEKVRCFRTKAIVLNIHIDDKSVLSPGCRVDECKKGLKRQTSLDLSGVATVDIKSKIHDRILSVLKSALLNSSECSEDIKKAISDYRMYETHPEPILRTTVATGGVDTPSTARVTGGRSYMVNGRFK